MALDSARIQRLIDSSSEIGDASNADNLTQTQKAVNDAFDSASTPLGSLNQMLAVNADGTKSLTDDQKALVSVFADLTDPLTAYNTALDQQKKVIQDTAKAQHWSADQLDASLKSAKVSIKGMPRGRKSLPPSSAQGGRGAGHESLCVQRKR